jgi:hypothetical protein
MEDKANQTNMSNELGGSRNVMNIVAQSYQTRENSEIGEISDGAKPSQIFKIQ